MKNNQNTTSLKSLFNKKYLLPILIILVVIASFSYSTFALVHARTKAIENDFKLQTTSIDIIEEFEDGDSVKKNVQIQNTGEATMYIRVALAEQLTKDGLIIPKTNAQPYFDYDNLPGDDWFVASDGFYYYSKQVKENEFTSILFTKAEPIYDVQNGEILSLDVLAEAIQVNGITKWTNVTEKSDGTLEVK